MKKLIFRITLFSSLIVTLVVIIMSIFRSSYPLFWIPATIISGLLLLYFPYEKFFKKKS